MPETSSRWDELDDLVCSYIPHGEQVMAMVETMIDEAVAAERERWRGLVEDLMSTDPDMPSHNDTMQRAEDAIRARGESGADA